ncbi:MAG: metal-dependent hydrolase [Candidatus Hodarchaeales archaeon]
MLPHIHLILGIILVNYLELNDLSSFFVILGSLLPDLDLILGTLWKKNHRTFISHYPLVWLFFALFFAFLRLDIYWLFVAGFIHLLVDVIDWEVYLLRPISNFKWSLFSSDPFVIIQGKTFREQIVLYYRQKKIICTELIVFGMFLLSLSLS